MANDPQRQRDQWRGPDFSITSFEAPESVKPGEEFTTVAVVAYRRHAPPYQTQYVIFEAGGTEIDEVPTDPEGRASVDHVFPEEGVRYLTAQIRGIPVSRVRRKVIVKEERPKVRPPHRLIVQIMGERGNYQLIIAVAAEDGTFIANAPVIVARNGVKADVFAAEEGMFVYQVRTGAHVKVSAGSTPELNWEGVLRGSE